MPSFLDIIAGTLPDGNECYPQTPQEFLDLIAGYLTVSFDETYSLLVKGPGPIAIEDQDKIWFQTDADGAPAAIRSFNTNTGDWESFIPGVGSVRPLDPYEGQLFLDTTINVLLIYERDDWRTVAGSPGDVKFVTASSEAAALTQNPGWIVYTAAAGRVLGAAGTGSGLTARAYGATTGEETHILTTSEMPAHTHSLSNLAQVRTSIDLDLGGVDAGAQNTAVTATGSAGSDAAHNNMQPTLFLYCLIKE